MKAANLIATALLVAETLAFVGVAVAAGGSGGARATSAHPAGRAAHHTSTWNRSGMRQRNRRFSGAYQYPNYANYGYGYGYGSQIIQNPDEADWAEQWSSLYEDNDGPYARSTRENPLGRVRMWEFPEDKDNGQSSTGK
jgi:hypothetical protein